MLSELCASLLETQYLSQTHGCRKGVWCVFPLKRRHLLYVMNLCWRTFHFLHTVKRRRAPLCAPCSYLTATTANANSAATNFYCQPHACMCIQYIVIYHEYRITNKNISQIKTLIWHLSRSVLGVFTESWFAILKRCFSVIKRSAMIWNLLPDEVI